MTPLIIDDNKLRKLKLFAENHPVNLTIMKKIDTGQLLPVGDCEGYWIFLDYGFKVVFSIEEHLQKNGTTKWFKHMVIAGTMLSALAIKLLIKTLGFKSLEQCDVRYSSKYIEVICAT